MTSTDSASSSTSSTSSTASSSGSGGDAGHDGGMPDGGGGTSKELAFIGTYLGGILGFSIDPSTGALVELAGSPFDAHAGLYAVAPDPSGRILYAANYTGNSIDAYRISPETGALTAVAGFPLEIDSAALSIAIDPQGRFAYVGNYAGDLTGNSIYVFAIDEGTGAFSPVTGSPFPVSGTADAIAPDPSGHFIYVTAGSAGGVQAFAVDASGALTSVTGSPFATTVLGGWMMPHPNLQVMYHWRSTLDAFSVDPATGALAALPGSPFENGQGSDPGSMGLAVDPQGRFVCAVNTPAGTVSVYSIESGGGLEAVAGSPFAAGTFPYSVAIDPDGRFLYVGNDGGDVAAFSIDQTTFALKTVPGSPFKAMGLQPEIVIVRAPSAP